jgi:hypothetical protein
MKDLLGVKGIVVLRCRITDDECSVVHARDSSLMDTTELQYASDELRVKQLCV